MSLKTANRLLEGFKVAYNIIFLVFFNAQLLLKKKVLLVQSLNITKPRTLANGLISLHVQGEAPLRNPGSCMISKVSQKGHLT